MRKTLVLLCNGQGGRVFLEGLKKTYRRMFQATAIVCASDNGGHSGELRRGNHNFIGIGDFRNCLAGASQSPLKGILDARLNNGKSLGNLLLYWWYRLTGDLGKVVAMANKVFRTYAYVAPVATEAYDVIAEFEDNHKVTGEWNIIQYAQQTRASIKGIDIYPSRSALGTSELMGADWIIFGPGALLTGIIPTLLQTGQDFRNLKARLIYVANLMTFPTDFDWSADDYVMELEKYIGRKLDYVIVNTGVIPPEVIKFYERSGFVPVKPVKWTGGAEDRFVIKKDLLPDNLKDCFLKRFNSTQFLRWPKLLTHDPKKTAETIARVILGENYED